MVIVIAICLLPILIAANKDALGLIIVPSTYLVLALIYFLVRRWGIVMNQHLVFRVTDGALWRELEIDEGKLNLFHQYLWYKTKANTALVIAMMWPDISSITENSTQLTIKSQDFSTLGNKGLIIIPRETENYHELKYMIESKAINSK